MFETYSKDIFREGDELKKVIAMTKSKHDNEAQSLQRELDSLKNKFQSQVKELNDSLEASKSRCEEKGYRIKGP
jgi:Skp family chaperone for outer membrane proteins